MTTRPIKHFTEQSPFSSKFLTNFPFEILHVKNFTSLNEFTHYLSFPKSVSIHNFPF